MAARTRKIRVTPFDAVRHLDNPEVLAHYVHERLGAIDIKLGLLVQLIDNVLLTSYPALYSGLPRLENEVREDGKTQGR
jgi:hypothetical protein